MAHLARTISVLWLLFITTMVPCFGSDLAVSPETSVAIQNLLEDQENLTVHCIAGNHDVGVHTLKPGENFSYHLRPNITGNTIFNCSFTWNGGICRRFDIYEHDEDNMFTNIKWQIYRDGPCMYTPHSDLYFDDEDDDDSDDDDDDDDDVLDDICYEWSDDPC
ncbi:hypothetical protein HN51_067197 [Arachis hypogaea]|uniref:S-protein homolog n=1 Tax=Arachis hypogaea TaxID=3818 RepID=A0A444ZMG7_ARAHY|nr:uncharacterized protein DS421_14g474210 [Arachis hypogaea]RYR15295.1 hypothetical protein Ahy_B04g072020 [Arachis hypogaea]